MATCIAWKSTLLKEKIAAFFQDRNLKKRFPDLHPFTTWWDTIVLSKLPQLRSIHTSVALLN